METEQSQQQDQMQQTTLVGVAKHVLSEELLLYLDRARALVAGEDFLDSQSEPLEGCCLVHINRTSVLTCLICQNALTF